MLFRVSSFDICHIYRMEKEQVYMTVGEPESSVILKYIWGTASEQEKGEVDLWLKKHPENEKALLQIARIYYVCRTQERIVSRDPLKAYWKVDKMLKSQSYLKKYQKKDRYVIFHRIVIELLKVAAIVLILLGGNFLLQKDDQMESLPSFQTLYVPAGQRAELILPDSTKVWLNANSKLVYPTSFKKGIRQDENGISIPNNLTRKKYIKKYWTTNIYTSYDFDINEEHNFTILAGMQFERGDESWVQGYKTDLISEKVPSFPTATGDALLAEALAHNATESYFARLNYNYKEKYLFEANVRYDGSYVFRNGKRWGTFPSFSVGWNLYNESFWENIEPYVNTLKVRASWGQLGNQNISPYSDLELIPISADKLNWIFNYGSTRPVGYTSGPNLVNRNLTWETATTTNVGMDLSFLNNRLSATVDWFERRTIDMVGPSQAMPGVLGTGVPKENNSTLRTRGWEISLNWKHALENGLSYNLGISLYDYKSVVTKYFNPTGTLSTWYEGAEVGDIWGYTVNDLFRSQEDLDSYLSKVDMTHIAANWNTGDLKYEDINHDGKVNNGTNTIGNHGDLSVIGNDQPHYQYTINGGVSYKGFDFSMLWRGVAKKDMYFYRGSNIYWGFMGGWWESCLTPEHLDYFRDQPGSKYSGLYEGDANINTDAYWPRPYLNNTEEAKNKNHANTRYLQNAAYLRLQNVQLGYSFPRSITSKMHLEKLRIYFSGENLLTFSKLPNGIDPVAPVGFPTGGEFFGTAGSGRLTYGADRIYSIGLTVTY